MSSNPLIGAPHVPKLAPEWGQFIDRAGAAVGQPRQGGRQATERSVWSQVRSNPYGSTAVPKSHAAGPLKPAWVKQQPGDDAANTDQALQQDASSLQQPAGLGQHKQRQQHTSAAFPQPPAAHRHASGHTQQATSRTAAHASAQRGPGSFRAALEGTADTPAHDDGADDFLDMLVDLGDIPNAATHQPSSWQPHQGQQHGQQHQHQHQHQQRQPTWGPRHDQQQAPQQGSPEAAQQHTPGVAQRPWQQQVAQGHVPHQQLQQHQQHQHVHQLHQQHPRDDTSRPQPAFDLESDDDVQLPDSLWDTNRHAAAAASNCAAPGATGAARAAKAPSVCHGGGGIHTAGSRAQTGTGQVLGYELQQPQQRPHAPCNQPLQKHAGALQGLASHQQHPRQHQQQQHQQEDWLDVLDLQQEDPWLQQLQHQTHQQHTVPRQQAKQQQPGWHNGAHQHSTAHAHQQQQQANYGGQPKQTELTSPWQHQQPSAPPPAVVQQHKRTAVASLWSCGTTLAGLSRVPAAGAGAAWGAAAAANMATCDTAGDTQQQGGIAARSAAAQKSSCLAAAGGVRTSAGGAQRQKASKAAGKGSRGGKGKAAGKGTSNSSISMEFTPRAPGDAAAQPKLHQTTLKETLKRAHRNKQRAQQQEGSSEQQGDMQDEDASVQYQQQDDSVDGIEQGIATVAASTAKPAARKRKRSSTAAAAAAAAAAGAAQGSGGSSSGAGSGSGVKAGHSGGGRAKKAPKISKTAAALETAVEALDTWCLSSNAASHQQQQQQAAVMVDATLPGTAVWQQLQRDVRSSEGVALGVLYSRTVLAPAGGLLAVQYFSSLQPPYKPQQLLLSKAANYAKRQAASSATADASAGADAGEAGQDAADTAGVQQVVGIAVTPVARGSTSAAAAAAGAGASGPAGVAAARTSYFVSLQQQQGQQMQLAPHVLQLLQAVLGDPGKRPCVCCSAKAVLCSLAQQGLQLPAASAVNVIDPELLGWLLDPQLIQDTKNEACYTLEQQLSRSGRRVLGVESLAPLQRLHQHLASSLDLATYLYSQLSRRIAGQAIKLEMQVAVLLAKMEVAGVACAPAVLSNHRATLAGRLAAIKALATQLVGHDFNLSSSSQLAKVLYEDLRLTPPAGGGGRGAAKTHLSTNEATLKQLSLVHELPGLVLEHRCIVNVMSKWIDAGWVQQAAQQPGARVHCTWQQTSTATGRLSSCSPNLQAVTKYTITARDGAGGAEGTSMLDINVRDAFVTPPGKLLLSADYSQIELRLLAHFSEDQLLRQILSQSSGDVFNMIAAALQQAGGRHNAWLSGAAAGNAGAMQVSPEERERAKRVVYGIVYGQTAYGLAQQLSDQAVSTAAAQGMIDSFLARFPGVRQFMQRSIAAAQSAGGVSTLMGRSRPIPGLQTGDFQERSAAERKVVNSQIQGSAADLIKLAMCAWDEWAAAQQQQQQQQQREAPASRSSAGAQARLIAQIHDELLFEVNAPDAVLGPAGDLQHPGQHFLQVSAAVRGIMESAAPMAVPLRVKLAWGRSWGSLTELQL